MTEQGKGIALRDYFAAKAMQVLLTNSDDTWFPNYTAQQAYQMADAMLEVRGGQPESGPTEGWIDEYDKDPDEAWIGKWEGDKWVYYTTGYDHRGWRALSDDARRQVIRELIERYSKEGQSNDRIE